MDQPYDLPQRYHERRASSDKILNGSVPAPGAARTGSLEQTNTITSDGREPRPPSPVALPEVSPPRELSTWDVASLIINKMIGTGIFTAPWTVLSMTKSPGLALGLWIIGFIYTGISMLVYLEFARKLPHTGGELIYLDETLPGPNFLSYTIYAFYFILFYNSATNSMRFANYVLRCATEKDAIQDERLIRFFAVVILSFLCVLHFRSARMARLLNRAFTAFKVAILFFVVFISGSVKAVHEPKPWSDSSSINSSSTAAAFLLILFSFSGWENATFVSGEIGEYKILKSGFIIAVSTVGTLYILINIVFLRAVAYNDILSNSEYVPLFFGDSDGAHRAWDVIIAISAAGSLLSVIYTAARVKQAIGKSNAFPWSRLWEFESKYKTPEGGLILHWIFSVILIIATTRIDKIEEAIAFPGSLQAYATGVIGVLVAIGFPYIGKETIPDPTREPGRREWAKNDKGHFRTTPRRVLLAAIYIIFNLYIVIVTFIPPYNNPDGKAREIKGWYYPVIVSSSILAGLVYYLVAFRSKRFSVFRLAKARGKIVTLETHDSQYGYRKYIEVKSDNRQHPSFLYRIFGGEVFEDED